jgi:hypothetical protein
MRIPGLPDPRPSVGDTMPPRVIDASLPGWDAPLANGSWLVVFAPLPEERGASTARAAGGLHRRFRDSGAHVLVVVPRSAFEDAERKLLSPDEIQRRLAEAGITSDVRIVLDPVVDAQPGKPSYGTLLKSRWQVRRDTTALVHFRGREEARTVPPAGAFTIEALRGVAQRALELGAFR